MTTNYLLPFIFVVLLLSCNSNEQNLKNKSVSNYSSTAKNNTIYDSTYKVKTFVVGNSWGYDIYKDNKLFIHQPNIPAIEGNQGFSSEEKAKLTASLIIQKLKNGIMPPSISIEELDSIDALK